MTAVSTDCEVSLPAWRGNDFVLWEEDELEAAIGLKARGLRSVGLRDAVSETVTNMCVKEAALRKRPSEGGVGLHRHILVVVALVVGQEPDRECLRLGIVICPLYQMRRLLPATFGSASGTGSGNIARRAVLKRRVQKSGMPPVRWSERAPEGAATFLATPA